MNIYTIQFLRYDAVQKWQDDYTFVFTSLKDAMDEAQHRKAMFPKDNFRVVKYEREYPFSMPVHKKGKSRKRAPNADYSNNSSSERLSIDDNNAVSPRNGSRSGVKK